MAIEYSRTKKQSCSMMEGGEKSIVEQTERTNLYL